MSFTSLFTRSIVLACLLCTTGCGTDREFAPLQNTGTLFADLKLNYKAILMSTDSPYDTVRLEVRAVDMFGNDWLPAGFSEMQRDSILAANPPEYISLDSTKVKVSQEGLVQAIGNTGIGNASVVRIIVRQQIDNFTGVDTALVRVPAGQARQAVMRYTHRNPDSLKVGNGSSLPLEIIAVDSNENTIPNVLAFVTYGPVSAAALSANATTGTFRVSGRQNDGKITVISSALIYGIAVADTFNVSLKYSVLENLEFSLVHDISGSVNVSFPIKTVIISSGGRIGWRISGDTAVFKDSSMSVIFEEPEFASEALPPLANTGSGNIFLPMGELHYRRFVKVGTYPFHIEPYGFTGVIVVKE